MAATAAVSLKARPRIVVIGGGCGGSAVIIHLLRAARTPLEILAVEPRRALGGGLAYGAAEAEHRINVPSDKMILFAEDPRHFTRWLERTGARAADPEGEAPRLAAAEGAGSWHYSRRPVFGAYMAATIEEALAAAPEGSSVLHLRARAVGVGPSGEGAIARLDTGEELVADVVALAASFEKPRFPWPLSPRAAAFPRLFLAPWDGAVASGIRPEHRLLILGTGLTMVDVAAGALRARGGAAEAAPVIAVSRNGRLPIPQRVYEPAAIPEPEAPPRTALELLMLARAHIRATEAAGGDWRLAIDGLRRRAEALWRGLPPEEQAKALRRLRSFWDVRRFRMAPQLWARIEAALADGARSEGRAGLSVRAARVLKIERTPAGAERDALRVTLRRPGGALEEIEVDALVNCIGPSGDVSLTENPALRDLLDAGRARPDPHRLGLEVDEAFQVIGADGAASPALRAMGPLTRGVFWEVMGVPELSAHARRLAERLAAELDAAAAGADLSPARRAS